MAITTIPWGDGSGDNIYLSAPSQTGDQSVSVTSDPNTGAARSKVVTFSASGVSPVSLTINQEAGVVEHTFTANPSSYIPKATDGSWYSLSDSSNAYKDADTTGYAQIGLTRGADAETWIYWLFDTSSIPADATIVSVECQVKIHSSITNASYVSVRQAQMYSGTTPKGESTLIPQPAAIKTMPTATWTREELNDVRLKMFGKRTTSNVNTAYSFRLYGATLTIKYTI